MASSSEQDELKNWLPHMMKWSFQSNDEANKKVTYTNICPLDSTLQLLWMLWKRGALLDEMFANDSVLLTGLRLINEGNESSHSVARKLWIDHNAQNGNNLFGLQSGENCLYLGQSVMLFITVHYSR